MKGDVIPDKNHISRLCLPKHVSEEQIQATAFMLRPGYESFLSVNWLEFLSCSNRKEEISALKKIYSRKLNFGARAQIAILNVGDVRNKVQTESNCITIDQFFKERWQCYGF